MLVQRLGNSRRPKIVLLDHGTDFVSDIQFVLNVFQFCRYISPLHFAVLACFYEQIPILSFWNVLLYFKIGLYKELPNDFRLNYAHLWQSLILADIEGIFKLKFIFQFSFDCDRARFWFKFTILIVLGLDLAWTLACWVWLPLWSQIDSGICSSILITVCLWHLLFWLREL